MSFTFRPPSIPDVVAVRSARHLDERASFTGVYREGTFRQAGIPAPTFGGSVARTLESETGETLRIPPGFADGCRVLSGFADVVYKVTQPCVAELSRGIRWDDAPPGIPWPVEDPILSEADREQPDREQPDLAEAGTPFGA